MRGEERAALLVIDMQEAVLAGCADVPGVIGRINGLLGRARRAGAPIVFVQHQDAEDPGLAAGSPGWHLVAALDRHGGDPVVAKEYRDSFAGTDLGAVLALAGVRRLVVTGAQSQYCVQTTALSAVHHGYDVSLVGDAHTTSPAALPSDHLAAETIVEFVNSCFRGFRHPGRATEVVPAAEVTL
jgi:nicotinamidase-related amidase